MQRMRKKQKFKREKTQSIDGQGLSIILTELAKLTKDKSLEEQTISISEFKS